MTSWSDEERKLSDPDSIVSLYTPLPPISALAPAPGQGQVPCCGVAV